MLPFKDSKFSHRFDHNGLVRSICLCCFRTVATAPREEDLERSDLVHRCPDEDLHRFTLRTQSDTEWSETSN